MNIFATCQYIFFSGSMFPFNTKATEDFWSLRGQTGIPSIITALKSAHNLMNWALTSTFHRAVTCCCLRPKRLDSHSEGSRTRESIKPRMCLLCAWFVRGTAFVGSEAPAGWWTYLVNNDTQTLLIDPNTRSHVDTGHQRSALQVFRSASLRIHVDTHIYKYLPALHRGESPQGHTDLTHIGSQMRSSHCRGIL